MAREPRRHLAAGPRGERRDGGHGGRGRRGADRPALPHLTDEFGAKRQALLRDLRDQVLAEKASVVSVASNTGITRLSEDGGRAQVVVFVDQDSRRGERTATLRMWATLTLVRDGDSWLLDAICIETECT